MPNPVEFWTPMHKRALRVLVILFSLSWAFEMYHIRYCPCDCDDSSRNHSLFRIIHFSELCHWIFLFNTMLYEGIQLRSNCLHAWIVGSAVVIIYMPIVAGIGSKDVTRVSFGLRCRHRGLIVAIVSSMDIHSGKYR